MDFQFDYKCDFNASNALVLRAEIVSEPKKSFKKTGLKILFFVFWLDISPDLRYVYLLNWLVNMRVFEHFKIK